MSVARSQAGGIARPLAGPVASGGNHRGIPSGMTAGADQGFAAARSGANTGAPTKPPTAIAAVSSTGDSDDIFDFVDELLDPPIPVTVAAPAVGSKRGRDQAAQAIIDAGRGSGGVEEAIATPPAQREDSAPDREPSLLEGFEDRATFLAKRKKADDDDEDEFEARLSRPAAAAPRLLGGKPGLKLAFAVRQTPVDATASRRSVESSELPHGSIPTTSTNADAADVVSEFL